MNAFHSNVGHTDIGNNSLHKEKHPDTFPPIINLLLCLALICSSAVIPLFLSNSQSAFTLSLIVSVLSAIIVMASSKKIFYSILFVLALAFSVFYFGTPIIPALIIGTLISVGGGSALLCAAKGSDIIFYIVSFPAAYAISLLITADPILSLTSLALLLPSISMGLTAKLDGGRTLTLSLCALAEGMLVCAAFAIWVFLTYGSLGFDAFDKAANEMVNGFVYYTEIAYSTISPEPISNAFRAEIRSLSTMTVNILPGMVGCVCIIASFLSHSVHMGLMSAYGIDRYVTKKSTSLTVSMEAALCFGIAYLITFATDSSNNVSFAATVAINICLILAPCLIHTGFGLILSLPRKLGFLGLILWIIIFIVLFNATISPLAIFALVGSAAVIITHIDSWAKDFYNKGDRL